MAGEDDNMDVEVDSNTVNSLLGPEVSSQQRVPGSGTGAKVQGGAAQKAPQKSRPNKKQRRKSRSVSVVGGPGTQAGSNPTPRSSSQLHPGRVSGHNRSGPQVSASSHLYGTLLRLLTP